LAVALGLWPNIFFICSGVSVSAAMIFKIRPLLRPGRANLPVCLLYFDFSELAF
jgi:hypothetical protein